MDIQEKPPAEIEVIYFPDLAFQSYGKKIKQKYPKISKFEIVNVAPATNRFIGPGDLFKLETFLITGEEKGKSDETADLLLTEEEEDIGIIECRKIEPTLQSIFVPDPPMYGLYEYISKEGLPVIISASYSKNYARYFFDEIIDCKENAASDSILFNIFAFSYLMRKACQLEKQKLKNVSDLALAFKINAVR